MDNISRENSSMLPVAGLVAGVIALVLSFVALSSAHSAGKTAKDLGDTLAPRIDAVEASGRTAATTANQAHSDISKLTNDTNTALGQVAAAIGDIRGDVLKLQEASKPKAAAGGKATGPVTAGPDEYIVKGGDIGTTIAKATGFSTSQIEAVNPGLDWKKLKVNQKLKLPARK